MTTQEYDGVATGWGSWEQGDNQMSIEQLSLYVAEAVILGGFAVGVAGYVIAVVIDTVRINRRLRGGEG